MIGAAHADETARLIAAPAPAASNPVKWSQSLGGVAANAARAAAPLASTRLHAAIGDDATGRAVTGALNASAVQFRPQIRDTISTGRYSAVLTPESELYLGLAATEIAETWTPAEIADVLLEANMAPVLAVDANLTTAALKALVPRPSGQILAALSVSPAKAVRLAPLAHSIDILITNRAEAAILAGCPRQTELAVILAGLKAAGFRAAVVTDGSAPLHYYDAGTASGTITPAPLRARVNTVNGAGDALAGGTLAGLANGGSLADSIQNYGLPAARAVLTAKSPAPDLATLAV
jgi:pseudouridine kinase